MKPLVVLALLAAALCATSVPGRAQTSVQVPVPAPGPGGNQPLPVGSPMLVGHLAYEGNRLALTPCREDKPIIVIDLSPENSVTAALTDIGLDRRRIYVELYGRRTGDSFAIDYLNRATPEGNCERAGTGVHWRAAGSEPRWSLTTSEQRVQLRRTGQEDVAVPFQPFTHNGRESSFKGRGDAEVEIQLTRVLCRDRRAEAVYGWRAQARVNADTQKGCGWRY